MGLLQECIKTYDCSSEYIGKYIEGKAPLAPVGHITTVADIEVTVNEEGEFLKCSKIPKKEKIIIPVTEDSSSRSANIAPHILSDNLLYLGGDREKYTAYISQLQLIADKEYVSKTIQSIYKYIEKNTLLSDLRSSFPDFFEPDSLDLKKEKQKSMVRWIVVLNGKPIKCWEDKETFDCITCWYSEYRTSDTNLCMVTGKEEPIAEKHLKGVVPFFGNAKIISANDTSGFTFRGRFIDGEESASISYEASQKAHNALKWVVENEGVIFGNKDFVCWVPEGIKVKCSPLQSMLGLEQINQSKPSEYKSKLQKQLLGNTNIEAFHRQVIICGFEAATSGRLAITYFNQIRESDYYERLEKWDSTCYWWKWSMKDKQYIVENPDIEKIVKYTFGIYRLKDERHGTFEVSDSGVLGNQIQNLINCRVNHKKIPVLIMRLLVEKASNLHLYYADSLTVETLLHITCSIITKYYYDYYGKEVHMELNNNGDLSYQFGRLLAIAEKAEKDTYQSDETREPYAIRMQTRFVQRPLHTFKEIQEHLKRSYYPRLSVGTRNYYETLIEEIFAEIAKEPEFQSKCNKPLKETYLVGYYLQKKNLYSGKEK